MWLRAETRVNIISLPSSWQIWPWFLPQIFEWLFLETVHHPTHAALSNSIFSSAASRPCSQSRYLIFLCSHSSSVKWDNNPISSGFCKDLISCYVQSSGEYLVSTRYSITALRSWLFSSESPPRHTVPCDPISLPVLGTLPQSPFSPFLLPAHPYASFKTQAIWVLSKTPAQLNEVPSVRPTQLAMLISMAAWSRGLNTGSGIRLQSQLCRLVVSPAGTSPITSLCLVLSFPKWMQQWLNLLILKR